MSVFIATKDIAGSYFRLQRKTVFFLQHPQPLTASSNNLLPPWRLQKSKRWIRKEEIIITTNKQKTVLRPPWQRYQQIDDFFLSNEKKMFSVGKNIQVEFAQKKRKGEKEFSSRKEECNMLL